MLPREGGQDGRAVGERGGAGDGGGKEDERRQHAREPGRKKERARHRERQRGGRRAAFDFTADGANRRPRREHKTKDEQRREAALARQAPGFPKLVVVERGRQMRHRKSRKKQNRRKRFCERLEGRRSSKSQKTAHGASVTAK